MCLSPWGNRGKIVFVWLSDWISPLYHGVICLHWFKLFRLDMSSFTRRRFTFAHRCPPLPPPPNLPALAVSLIYEMPLIWPKCLLWDLPPLSSLHLLHSSLSSVTLQSKSEECIAQQAIHRLDNLTNMLMSIFLLCSLSLPRSLFPCYPPLPPFLPKVWKKNEIYLFSLHFSYFPLHLLSILTLLFRFTFLYTSPPWKKTRCHFSFVPLFLASPHLDTPNPSFTPLLVSC